MPYLTPEPGVAVMAWGVRSIEDVRPEESVPQVESELPGFALLGEPLYRAEDTGVAIPPDTQHPSSVVMPTAEITQQFNLLGDVVLSHQGELPVGYPRFVVPTSVKELSYAVMGKLNALPFPTREAAESAAHLANTYDHGNNAEITEAAGLFWLQDSKMNTDAWQHTGLGVSSRHAQAILEGRGENDRDRLVEAEHAIKTLIREESGARYDDIYLFPTGMAAIYTLNQALIKISGDAAGVQFGFPYTDTFEQRKYGPNVSGGDNIIDLRAADYDALAELVASGRPLRHVMTECPGNPKLWTPDFHRLEAILQGEAPIIIDDTIGTFFNVDDDKLPDSVAARVTSLTKFFSSVGDVMGGSIILRPESIYYGQLKQALAEVYQDTLWYEDAEVLAKNGTYFRDVMPAINENGAALAEWLDQEWAGDDGPLELVYHPTLTGRNEYDAVKKDGAGYGGVMSLKFKDPERAYKFFDAINVTKGPSLGTYYTLACLYTWLAHKPVGSVSKFGVTPDLIRISAGIEDFEDLKMRFEQAFSQSK